MIGLYDHGNLSGLLEKGHVSKQDFAAEALAEYGRKIMSAEVRHTWGRFVGAANEFHLSKPGSGAFLCTYWQA